jgi:hypothetical protein
MSNSVNSVKSAAAGVTRGYSRFSILAASATVAGVLGAAGFAVGSAPWAQAAGEATQTVQSGSQSTAGHSSTTAFETLSGTGGVHLDALRAAGTGGSTGQVSKPAQAAVDAKAKPAQAKHAAAAKHAPAKPAPAKHKAKKAAAKKKAYQYPIYDSVTPSALPHHKVAAVYANGAYRASYREVAGQKSVLWIDTNGSNPGATVLDVEPGDATPHGAAVWVQHRLAKHPNSVAIVYTMRSSWQAVKDNVAHLPKWQQDKVRYWIADPTGHQHMVPGADATQWYWGAHIDISVANSTLTTAR